MQLKTQNFKLPNILYLESTNRCNLRCKGCILYHGGWEPNRDMSLKEVVMITDQLQELERIYLHGIGEPLLNKELPDIIKNLKNRKVYVLFNSNGILLDAQWQQALIDTGLDELRISLDAASSQGYEKIRNSDSFEKIVNNLRLFLGLQKRQNVTHPKISLWFLGTKDTISELPSLIKLAAELSIEEVYLQRLVFFQDDIGYGIARRAETLQGAKDGSSELIQKSQDLASKLGIELKASGMSEPFESLRRRSFSDLPWRQCYRPSTLMYITANGNVLPCCISPFSTVDYRSIILGNVFKDSLAEIWTNSNYENFRKQHQSEIPPKCCRGCGIQWSL